MVDINDPYIHLIAETLIKTAASKTIELGLNGISKLLGKAVQAGDEEEIVKILASDEDIKIPALRLANEALAGAFLVPVIPSKKITADELLDLFTSILRVGFNISRTLKCDICLPGSIIDSASVTWFTSSNADLPAITREDRLISIPFKPGSEIGIYPEAKPVQICQAKMEEIRSRRELTTSYIKAFDSPFKKGVMITALNSQRVQFSTVYPDKKISSKLGIENGWVIIRNWSEGINLMIDFIPKIPDLDALTASSTTQLLSIIRKITTLANDMGHSE